VYTKNGGPAAHRVFTYNSSVNEFAFCSKYVKEIIYFVVVEYIYQRKDATNWDGKMLKILSIHTNINMLKMKAAEV